MSGSALPVRLQPAPACGVSTTWWCWVVLSGGDGNGGPAQSAGCGAQAVLEPSQAPLPPTTTTSLIPDVDLTLPVCRHSLSLSARNMS